MGVIVSAESINLMCLDFLNNIGVKWNKWNEVILILIFDELNKNIALHLPLPLHVVQINNKILPQIMGFSETNSAAVFSMLSRSDNKLAHIFSGFSKSMISTSLV